MASGVTMEIRTAYSHEIKRFWYWIADAYDEPIIVSPAIYNRQEDALRDAKATLTHLENVTRKHTAKRGIEMEG